MAGSGGDLEGQWSLLTAALYGILSFSVVLAAALLILLACRKKYSLNWFEKNLLESAKAKETSQSDHEALMTGGEESGSVAGCSDCEQGDNKFWVPPALLPRSTSSVIPAHEASAALAVDPILATTPTADDVTDLSSGPQTPKTPLSISSGGENSPGYRPRLSSMQTRLDHTKIDTTLYQKQKEAEEATAGPSLGAVHLSLMYDPPAGILSVRLLEAQDLRARDFSGTADPYAKIRLLPDRNNVWQTRIHKKTLNPVFDEDFVFEVSAARLAQRTLEVLLYDFDAYSRHQCIGGLQLPLAQLELAHKITLWKQLSPHSAKDAKVELGDLMVSLSFLPSAERLTIVVLKARNLRIVDDARSTSDPYVRISLSSSNSGKRSRKKRTSVQRGTVNPVFNEAITFDVSREVLSRSILEFSVMSDEELLGLTRLGSATSEASFFREMLSSRTATARWLPLSEPD